MEFSPFIILVSLFLCFLIKSLLTFVFTKKPNLPPGLPKIPTLFSYRWFLKGFSDLEPTLRRLHSKHGPIVTLKIGRRNAIFISSHELAHKALITHGSTFATRPPTPLADRYFSARQHNINAAGYGPLWRLLRRNLTSEILHPSRVKSYSHARKWVLDVLMNKLKQESNSGRPVCFIVHFQYAMFCLLVLMCFGDKLEDKTIREVERVQRDLLINGYKFGILSVFPRLGKILFREKWRFLLKLLKNQEDVLLPLIESHREKKKDDTKQEEKEETIAYVDTLLNLTLPEEGGRKLNEAELVTLCSEFLNAGTDTTSTALQWIMANLVKQPEIQVKIVEEIKAVCGDSGEIKEEDLQKMKYLKAVVLEGLRRHPPGHMLLPHAVTEDVRFKGYDIPSEGTTVNFLVAEMGWDPKVWEDPMDFKPERFMMKEGEAFDITGTREIKMMPFGAGRRICPGLGLAMLHLEYFVANLVKEFDWKVEDGGEVDLTEKTEFTIVMKNPLRAVISPRKL